MILGVLYTLPAAFGTVVARTWVPHLIRDAYEGRSLPRLNRVFRRQISHPLGHYLDLWQSFWQALLLAWWFHLLVVVVTLALDRRLAGKRGRRTSRGLGASIAG